METKVSEILENILGLLGLEGSFEVNETEEEVEVTIETKDAGRLIGFRGETLDALQLIINQLANKSGEGYKRVVIDVQGWRKNKEDELVKRAKDLAAQVIEAKKPVELEPMPSWQRRIIHMTLSEMEGVYSESAGDGKERHLIVSPGEKPETAASQEPESTEKADPS